jgi:hypothetical protein
MKSIATTPLSWSGSADGDEMSLSSLVGSMTVEAEVGTASLSPLANVDEKHLSSLAGGVFTLQQEARIGEMMREQSGKQMTRSQAMMQVGVGTALGFGGSLVGNMAFDGVNRVATNKK